MNWLKTTPSTTPPRPPARGWSDPVNVRSDTRAGSAEIRRTGISAVVRPSAATSARICATTSGRDCTPTRNFEACTLASSSVVSPRLAATPASATPLCNTRESASNGCAISAGRSELACACTFTGCPAPASCPALASSDSSTAPPLRSVMPDSSACQPFAELLADRLPEKSTARSQASLPCARLSPESVTGTVVRSEKCPSRAAATNSPRRGPPATERPPSHGWAHDTGTPNSTICASALSGSLNCNAPDPIRTAKGWVASMRNAGCAPSAVALNRSTRQVSPSRRTSKSVTTRTAPSAASSGRSTDS